VPDRPVHARELASVVYTSGTTGPAKGVMMPHGQISLFARLGIEGANMTEDDAHYCFIPLYHVAGKFMAMYASLITGGRVIVDTAFSADQWLPRVRQYGATMSHVHGPLVEMIYNQPVTPEDADNQVTRIVASPFPAKIAHDFERRFRLRGIETWGMTEVTVPVWQPHDQPLQTSCCGFVREEYFDLRIVDPDTDEEVDRGATGELVLRPRQPWTIMQGYLRNPEATANAWRNLWFHTGDLGRMDDDGRVYFVDRAKERIRRRAENVSSYDIEAAALNHPDVRECAAVGVPSEFEGDDDILLYVVPQAGASRDPEGLIGHLATELPHFMVPRYLTYVDDLPRTPTGKTQKALLRDVGKGAETWDRKAAGVSLRDLAAADNRS
jgi:crotonobetaine/carnitine-CoA ligase